METFENWKKCQYTDRKKIMLVKLEKEILARADYPGELNYSTNKKNVNKQL